MWETDIRIIDAFGKDFLKCCLHAMSVLDQYLFYEPSLRIVRRCALLFFLFARHILGSVGFQLFLPRHRSECLHLKWVVR